MARKTNKSEEGQRWSGNFGNADFADVNLTASDKTAYLAWMKDVSGDFSETLTLTLAEGYRVSFKRDYENACEICSLTQQDRKHHNHDLVISSRSDDAEEAFWLCVYKVTVLYPGERLPTRSETRRDWG